MTDTQTTLLVAERDESTREHLLANLAADGYQPRGAQTVEETRLKLRDRAPALLVLGALEQESRTLALLRGIRTGQADGDPAVPVIMIGDGVRSSRHCAPLRPAATTSWRGRSPTWSCGRACAPACAAPSTGGFPSG